MRIEAQHLSKRYGRAEALRDVSFEIPAGRRVALVGPNGSGKTTLNRIVMGLLSHEGVVRVGGRAPLRERVAIARHMAYVPQSAPLTAATVAEMVDVIRRVRGLDPERLAKVAASLEMDLAKLGRVPFRGLSGGMRQKLLIAIALSSEARLLVLDEPTGSLDPRSRDRFFELFAGLAPDTTLLLCSHRMEEIVPLVDHVLALDDGRVAYHGPVDAFLDARALSVLELRVRDETAAARLAERGFRRGQSGWWLRTTPRGEKSRLLRELTTALGAAIEDLNLRDLEALDLERGDADREDPDG